MDCMSYNLLSSMGFQGEPLISRLYGEYLIVTILRRNLDRFGRIQLRLNLLKKRYNNSDFVEDIEPLERIYINNEVSEILNI